MEQNFGNYEKELKASAELRRMFENPGFPQGILSRKISAICTIVDRLAKESEALIQIGKNTEQKLIQANQKIEEQRLHLSWISNNLEKANQALSDANNQNRILNGIISSQKEEMERLTMLDSLTRLYNGAFMNQLLEREFQRAKRYQKPLSVAMVDIDFFKTITENFSENIRKTILVEVAAIFRNNCRFVDYVTRSGGEEFVLIFPETNEKGAQVVCERLRGFIENKPWKNLQAELSVTVSMGLCDNQSFDDHHQLLSVSSEMMLLAIQNGGNRIYDRKMAM